ncbi:MAG: GGDEF domain-containing protein [Pseudomonadales bacterium]|nr:GGDEF domain-containing protein [Pseudomonadales bacterium]
MPKNKDINKFMVVSHRIIPDSLLEDLETRLKSEVLLITLAGIMLISMCLIPVLFYFFAESPAIRDGGITLIGLCMASYVVSLFILNRFAALNTAGNITLAGIFMGAVISSWATGGIYSPLMYTLLIPPVFAFVFTNLRSALFWSMITVVTFLAIWGIDELAFRYPVMEQYESMQVIINAADVTALNIIMPLASLISILLVVASYEVSSKQMKKLLTQERNMFAFKASHDSLTGLGNRAEFDTRLQMSIDAAWHSDYPLALIYIDLDGFKPINDTLGHHAGDVVLRIIAKRLAAIVRGTDMVARLGGDEFAIILQGIGDNDKMQPIMEKILSTISQDITLDDGQSVNVSGSLGVAYYPENADTADRLCRYADMAMYLAKEEKNTWRFYQQVPHPSTNLAANNMHIIGNTNIH